MARGMRSLAVEATVIAVFSLLVASAFWLAGAPGPFWAVALLQAVALSAVLEIAGVNRWLCE